MPPFRHGIKAQRVRVVAAAEVDGWLADVVVVLGFVVPDVNVEAVVRGWLVDVSVAVVAVPVTDVMVCGKVVNAIDEVDGVAVTLDTVAVTVDEVTDSVEVAVDSVKVVDDSADKGVVVVVGVVTVAVAVVAVEVEVEVEVEDSVATVCVLDVVDAISHWLPLYP